MHAFGRTTPGNEKVTELCTGGELFDRILEKTESDEGRYSERDAMTLVTKILSAIAYCHDEHHICHRFGFWGAGAGVVVVGVVVVVVVVVVVAAVAVAAAAAC